MIQNHEAEKIWPVYIQNILQKFGMADAKVIQTPVNPSLRLKKATEDSECVDQEL